MKFIIFAFTAGLASLAFVSAADTFSSSTSSTSTSAFPASTDASAYLVNVLGGATPTWATGAYATSLATALYSIQTSFADRSDHTTIISALWSAASAGHVSGAVASLHQGEVPLAITSQAWFTSNVPAALQTEVVSYASEWEHAIESVGEKATASQNAAGPRCTGMAVAGVAFGVAAFAAAV